MDNKTLRFLTPSEVEVRLQSDKPDKDGNKKYLLYMDARAARRLLNERFGIYGWQLLYEHVNGQLFAKLGIKDPESGQWVWKMETGSESNIECEKGQVSDALKRAVVTLGWDELYSSPDIRFNGYSTGNSVQTIEYDTNSRRIIRLVIVDRYGKVVFNWAANQQPQAQPVQGTIQPHTAPQQAQPVQQPQQYDKAALIENIKANARVEASLPHANIGMLKKFVEYYINRINDRGWQGNFDFNAMWSKWQKKGLN